MRVEVAYKAHLPDGRAAKLLRRLRSHYNSEIRDLSIIDVYLINEDSCSPSLLADLFLDPVAQEMSIDSPILGTIRTSWSFAVEVIHRPGVADPVGATAQNALSTSLTEAPAGATSPGGATKGFEVRSAVLYAVQLPEAEEAVQRAIAAALYNPLIQEARIINRAEWRSGARFASWYPSRVSESPDSVELYRLAGMSEQELSALSRSRLLALSEEEMHAVQRHFADPATLRDRERAGLSPAATDVELEMIAQTWSEHCKHKIFNAQITYRDETVAGNPTVTIESLFSTYIRATTDALRPSRAFLKSVFHDNSGVISFDEDHLICFKVETHNSPSALDPYGGAITGIVGVNRDILGTGKCAKPLWNTDVLCFGFPDTLDESLPAGLLPPRQVMDGVHRGIIDGGNQSGIPVVSGAFLFDESFTGKPLVFCGTGGILPAWIGEEEGWVKHIEPGDFAVMVGGRIGKDGIHGATFSSQALDETSPTSAVQIGDPITQRKMTDFLLEARDLRLFRGITDNGAGGLSSSLGEMAETCGGVHVDLDACPTKYAGLAAWEIWVSESQERMSLAVSRDTLDRLLELARDRDVEATVIGQFTNSGYVDIDYHGKPVCRLKLDFLHNGLPHMQLSAVWPRIEDRLPHAVRAKAQPSRGGRKSKDAPTQPGDNTFAADTSMLKGLVLSLLADPNIASKETLVRQYDHEVKGHSAVKPFCGASSDGPTDGAVITPLYDSKRGITVTHGICPRYSDYDTYDMALCAVDEAYRSHIILGGDPDHAAALDNFCWPDPVLSAETPDGELKLAQLVRACRGLQEACMAYGLPLVSGKDSMKNDARVGGRKISVRPTLLVSLFGVITDARKAITPDLKRSGSLLYLVGETRAELGGSALQRLILPSANAAGPAFATVPTVRLEAARKLYRAVALAIDEQLILSAHDLSDGGLAVAAAEAAIGGRLGAVLDLSGVEPENPLIRLFSETPSRFLIEVAEQNVDRFEKIMAAGALCKIGRVIDEPLLTFALPERVDFSVDELVRAWKQPIDDSEGAVHW